MLVEKRNGQKVPVSFDAISDRIRRLCQERGLATDEEKGLINVELLAQKTISAFPSSKDRILKTSEIDALSAEIAEFMTLEYGYSYHKLAGYLLVSNLQKETPNRFSEAVRLLHDSDPDFLDPAYVEFVAANAEALDALVQDARDFRYDYFGIQTLKGQKSGYLLRDVAGKTLERPQYMHLRVAIVLSDGRLETITRNYEVFSELAYTHATPTLLNAGKKAGNLASCFLLDLFSDSLEGILNTVEDAAQISKRAGGIGVSVARVRARDSVIHSSRGKADGVAPMLKGFDWVASYVNQAGARKGAIAIYLPPYHLDCFEFLELKTNDGDENSKCRNLFQGLWIPDLFMKRVEADADWSLFSPDDTPDLPDLYGPDFEEAYVNYEKAGKARKVVKAQTLWFQILKTQIETGGPYMLYADACNQKSNQKNIGVIQSSNLCSEILEVANDKEIANCNLASISLPYFVRPNEQGRLVFDFADLRSICGIVVENLNRVIDKTFYPTWKCKNSNLRHRPLGIGVQGLADVFMMLGLPYDSPAAAELNRQIFEHMYFAGLSASIDLAIRDGPYQTYPGSPLSKGILQPDFWDCKEFSEDLDWENLRSRLATYGARNSLLIALMPTASSASIMGNIESFEPQTTNLYNRRTQNGEYFILNRHLVRELETRNLWKPEIFQEILRSQGSVKTITELPADVRNVYKTCWELKAPVLVDMAAGRAPFICQSQSFNCFMAVPTFEKLTAYHFYAWKKGLKTGMYYLRSKPVAEAQNVVVVAAAGPVCRIGDPNCQSCSA